MKKRFAVAGLAGIALLGVHVPALADSHEEAPAPLSDVWIVMPKQGMESEFEDAIKTHMAFRADAGESRSWNTYTPVAGHKLGMYQFRHCCFDWADMDAYIAESVAQGLGENWDDNVHAYVAHYHHYFERMDMEHSYWPDEGTSGPYYEVTTWTWKEDAGPGPSEAREKLSKAALEAGWGEYGSNWLWMSRLHGKPKLMIVSSYESYADMTPPEMNFFEFMAQSMPEEEVQEAFAAFGAGFSSSETTIWRHREDLSSPGGDD